MAKLMLILLCTSWLTHSREPFPAFQYAKRNAEDEKENYNQYHFVDLAGVD